MAGNSSFLAALAGLVGAAPGAKGAPATGPAGYVPPNAMQLAGPAGNANPNPGSTMQYQTLEVAPGVYQQIPMDMLPNSVLQPGMTEANTPTGGGVVAANAAFGALPARPGPAAAAPAAAPPPSLASALAGILGPTPTAPTAGTAPTLSDFFSTAPYQQAQSQLSSGTAAAGSTTNAAYGQALQQLAQLSQQSQTEQAQTGQQIAGDQSAIQGQSNNALAAAGGAGPNTGLGQRLTALAGILGGQQTAEKNLNQNIDGIQNQGLLQDGQTLGNEKAGALAYLTAQSQGESQKITAQEAADQTKGQQDLVSAQGTYADDYAKAQQDYQTSLDSRNTAAAGLEKSGLDALSGTQTTGHDTALNTINQYAVSGTSSQQNLAAAFNSVISPVAGPSGTKPPSPTNLAQAWSSYQANIPAWQKAGATPQEIQQLGTLLQQYYDTSKAAPTSTALAQYLAQLGPQASS